MVLGISDPGSLLVENEALLQALRESELKHRTLFEAAGDAILLLRQDRFLDCNAQTLVVFGCTREQIIGESPHKFSPELQPDGQNSERKALQIIQLALTEGTPVFEWLHCRADGSPFTAEVSLTRLEVGGETLLQTIVRDVTARKRVEAHVLRLNRLYATLTRLNRVVAEASDRDALLRESCRVAVECGQFLLAWVGMIDEAEERVKPVAFAGREQGYLSQVSIAYRDEELGKGPTGTAIREGRCVSCQDIARDPRMAAWREAALERGFRSSAAVPIRQSERVIGAFMVYAGEPGLFDAAEEGLLVELGQVISHALDGLEREAQRRRAEEDLQQLNQDLERRVAERTDQMNTANEELRAKNQELKDFAYTVSHDLKAPLRGIAGYASELQRKHQAGLSERAQFCLDQILTATSHLDQLIEDLLHYSRLDAESPSMTDVDLRGLIERIVHDRDLILSQHQVEMTVDLPFTAVRSWERGLLQVLSNLIDNAIKYSTTSQPPRVHVVASASEGAWRLSVSDNGIGFDMKYHDRIFGLFNRLVRMEDYAGTGAGLAIVKKVLDKMQGRIWAESTPGQGATFHAEMPRSA